MLVFIQHCDILRKAAEAGGLLVDAMINIQDGAVENYASAPLMVVENGCGSPCLDFRQVSSELAAVAKDADLVPHLLYQNPAKYCILLSVFFISLPCF